MPTQIPILSPLDIVPGAVSPDGRTIAQASLFSTPRVVLVTVEYSDGATDRFTWPTSTGWTSPANIPSVTHTRPYLEWEAGTACDACGSTDTYRDGWGLPACRNCHGTVVAR